MNPLRTTASRGIVVGMDEPTATALAQHFPMHYPHGWECRCDHGFSYPIQWADHVVQAVGLPECGADRPTKKRYYVAQHFPRLNPDLGYICGCGYLLPTGPTVRLSDTADAWARHVAEVLA